MSYASTLRALKNSLVASTHLDGIPCKVLVKLQNRNDLTINSTFAVEIIVPDGVFVSGSDTASNTTTGTSVGALVEEVYSFIIRCKAVQKNKFDDLEKLNDPDVTDILDLFDKSRNACADFFFAGDYTGLNFGAASFQNGEDTGLLVVEYPLEISEQIEMRTR